MLLFLPLVIGGLAALFFGAAGIIFIVWAVREHLTARRHRRLIALYHELKRISPTPSKLPDWVREAKAAEAPHIFVNPSIQWEVVYREGKRKRTVLVLGKDESEAMREVGKQSIRFDSIVSLKKVGG